MNKLIIILLLVFIGGCSSWPKVEIMGDDYYISPLGQGESVTVESPSGGRGSTEDGRRLSPQ